MTTKEKFLIMTALERRYNELFAVREYHFEVSEEVEALLEGDGFWEDDGAIS